MLKTVNIITENFGKYNPSSIEEYEHLGGFKALKAVLIEERTTIIDEIKTSGLRGRGGAAYPTGVKLEQSAAVPGERKIVICNADEGEPGTFKDRELIKQDPFKILEGMIICAWLTNGTEGYVYIREEYTYLHENLRKAVDSCRKAGYLGENILGSGLNFDIKVFSGAGAYVCGEGGALIESIEGKQGKPRNKPPFTKERGLWQLPTLVINVETLSAIPSILNMGAEQFAAYGTGHSKGTKVISISGKVHKPGVYEIPFGVSLNEIVYELAGGIRDGKQAKFLQIGGASGPIVPAAFMTDTFKEAFRNLPEDGCDCASDAPVDNFAAKLCYQDLWDQGFDVGSGAIVVADETVSLAAYLETVYEFFADESCGKCTPCREGNRQIVRMLSSIIHGTGGEAELDRAVKYARHMKGISFCGLGKTAPAPLLTAVKHMKSEILK